MKNWMKNVDMDQIKDQIAEVRDQVQDLHFRKPWTRGNEASPALFMALGAALALAGVVLYRNREQVAEFCSNCGAELKGKWESSGMKEKASRMMAKAKEARNQAGMETSAATNASGDRWQ